MENNEKEVVKLAAEKISELLKGDLDSKYRALEIADAVEDETLRRRLLGQIVSDITLSLEEQGTAESQEQSRLLKEQYFQA